MFFATFHTVFLVFVVFYSVGICKRMPRYCHCNINMSLWRFKNYVVSYGFLSYYLDRRSVALGVIQQLSAKLLI